MLEIKRSLPLDKITIVSQEIGFYTRVAQIRLLISCALFYTRLHLDVQERLQEEMDRCLDEEKFLQRILLREWSIWWCWKSLESTPVWFSSIKFSHENSRYRRQGLDTMVQLYISAISFFSLTLDHDPEYFLEPMNFDLRTIRTKRTRVTSSLTRIVGN